MNDHDELNMPRPGPPGGRHRGGYSLLEMAIVVAAAALIAGIAIPRVGNSVARYGAEAAARRVSADLALARGHARATGKPQAVTFTVGSSAYQLPNVTGLRGGSTAYAVDLRESPYNASVASVNFGGSAAVTFDRYGKPSSSGTVVVQAGASQRTVTLDATSGRVTIQ